MDQQVASTRPSVAAVAVRARPDRRLLIGAGAALALLLVAAAVWWATRPDTSVRYTTYS